MNTGEMIRYFRKRRKMTQQELGDALGVAANTISDVERGKYSLNLEFLGPLSEALGVMPSELLQINTQLDDSMRGYSWGAPILAAYKSAFPETQKAACAVLSIPHIIPDAPPVPKMREMLVYTYPAAAGLPLYAESDFERIEFPEDDIPTKADFGIRICGDSMEPTIEDGSIVWVHKQTTIHESEIGIFMLGDSAVCKRAHMNGNDRIKYLKSDNPAYEPISGSDLEGLRVVGRVLLQNRTARAEKVEGGSWNEEVVHRVPALHIINSRPACQLNGIITKERSADNEPEEWNRG